jgi:catechol 2,3-dioxygenase-like lactoylglutathione lyase family enzyme
MSSETDEAEVVENTIPVLAVTDVAASVQFYCEKLGFKLDWGGAAARSLIASVSRDGHAIMLEQCRPMTAGRVWIGISRMDRLWKSAREAGLTVAKRPTNQRWALEMKLEDPDGNVLWFGTDPLEDIAVGEEVSDEQIAR